MQQPFQLGPWRIEPSLNRLIGPEGVVQLEPKLMRVLVCLAENPGAVVTKQQLLDAVWRGTVVGEDVLSRAISELRKLLGDEARNPHLIETIYKTGYRLIAPISLLEPDPLPAPQGATRRTEASSLRRAPAYMGVGIGLVLVVGLLLWSFGAKRSPSRPPARPTPVTTFPGYEYSPAFSPDGSQIAFTWNGEEGGVNFDLYVKPMGVETPRRLTTHPGHDGAAAWSPDGRLLAFSRAAPQDCGLYLIPAIGGAERRLAGCGAASVASISWVPGGPWLAYTLKETEETPYRVYLISTATGECYALTNPPLHYKGDYDVAISPDGRHLAFTRTTSSTGNEDLYVAALIPQGDNLTLGSPTQRTFDQTYINGVTWGPEGDHLFFASKRDGESTLWQIARGGGPPTSIAAPGWYLKNPSMSVAGRLAYTHEHRVWNLWRRPGPGAAPDAATRFVTSTHWEMAPQYSPDGTRLAFISYRSGSPEVWIAEADGSLPFQRTSMRGAFIRSVRWAPNGQAVLFDASVDGQTDLFWVEVEDGTVRRLTDHPAHDLNPVFSEDMAWIYFGSDRRGTWQVWKMPTAGGPTVQVTQEGGFYAVAPPDREVLYYAKFGVAGLWQRPLAGGAERSLPVALDASDWGNWGFTEDALFFMRRTPETAEVVFLDPGTEEIRHVLPLPGSVIRDRPSLAVAPDGRWVLYAQEEQGASDIMMMQDVP